MTASATAARPVPRWLHAWALGTVALTAVLLALGGVVTTFRVGMADPVWPTAPWYLFFISWREPSAGFLIEHTHRLAGWSVGAAVAVLAMGLWFTERRPLVRWMGAVALVALLGAFGQFHRDARAVEPGVTPWPLSGAVALLVALAAVAGACVATVIGRTPARGLRVAGVLALLAVMTQGLLGGLRVKLNALVGTDLAAVHGCFAQVVFCLLVGLAVYAGRSPAVTLPVAEAGRLRWLAVLLTALLFVQLIWGALVRHLHDPLAQRGHFLTAFAVVAVAAWLARAATERPARQVIGGPLVLLGVLLGVQLLLGVEAWMRRFAGVALPEAQLVTLHAAAVRTAHVLVGSWVLATAFALALRIGRACPCVCAEREAPAAEEDFYATSSVPAGCVALNGARGEE